MTLEITGLSDETVAKLGEKASIVGVETQVYLRRLIERAVAAPAEWMPLSELLGPIHDYTEAHSISEAEIESFWSKQLVETRRERQELSNGGRTAG